MANVQGTLSAMEISGFAGDILPNEEDLPVPFDDPDVIINFFRRPANTYVLARYVAQRIGSFQPSTFPRLFTEIPLEPAYKKRVYWPAVAGR